MATSVDLRPNQPKGTGMHCAQGGYKELSSVDLTAQQQGTCRAISLLSSIDPVCMLCQEALGHH